MDSRVRVRFEIVSSVAVFASIIVMALETFDLPAELAESLLVLDILLSLGFLAEYGLRVATAESKRRYITSFYGIIDLLALLPLLFHAAASLRVLRLLRVLRVLRLLKLTRYTKALDRFGEAVRSIAAEAALFISVAMIFVIGFAFLIFEVEHEAQPELYGNIFDAIWWAVISLTSVGYGDVYPVTPAGRLLTIAMVLTGMGIVAVPTALLASALGRAHGGDVEV